VEGGTCRASARPASRAHFCSGSIRPCFIFIMAVPIQPSGPLPPSIRPSDRPAPVTSIVAFTPIVRALLLLCSGMQQVGLVSARPYVLAALSDFLPIQWLLPRTVLAGPSSKRGTVAGLTTAHRNCPVGSALVQIKAQAKVCTMLLMTLCT
jgi:hypothetical protein